MMNVKLFMMRMLTKQHTGNAGDNQTKHQGTTDTRLNHIHTGDNAGEQAINEE